MTQVIYVVVSFKNDVPDRCYKVAFNGVGTLLEMCASQEAHDDTLDLASLLNAFAGMVSEDTGSEVSGFKVRLGRDPQAGKTV